MAISISLPWIFSVLLLLVSFGKQHEPLPSQENPYEGCCGLEPVVFKVGAGSVYIPNVVTPNGSGINAPLPLAASEDSLVGKFTKHLHAIVRLHQCFESNFSNLN